GNPLCGLAACGNALACSSRRLSLLRKHPSYGPSSPRARVSCIASSSGRAETSTRNISSTLYRTRQKSRLSTTRAKPLKCGSFTKTALVLPRSRGDSESAEQASIACLNPKYLGRLQPLLPNLLH